MLLVFIRALVKDAAAVDDVHQETLVTAWKTLDRFDRDRPFAPWLRGIARNHVFAHYRRTRRLPVHCEETVLNHLDARIDQIGQRAGDTWEEKLEVLDDCLALLPEPNRTLLDLHYREEMDTERIAIRTDLRRETVKKRLQRIRSSLAECLQRKGVFDQAVTD
ncbi:MAG: RNA polymerase factor sigma-70 [Phycisphaerae bacterium]|nr:RNA polymerase factor sigma-70 [Phycisphaerae bacterium]